MRALLLEPDCTIRETIGRALAERGWRVELASSGAEAVERFRERAFPLVVLGADREGNSAAAVCRELRAAPAGGEALLLVVPAAATPEALLRLGEAGADDYLERPLSAARLSGRIAFVEARIGRGRGRPAPGAAGPPSDLVAELEETLHAQQALLEGIFRSAPEGIAVVDGQQRIVRVNAEFTRMFGYSEAEARGRAIDDLIVPESACDEASSLTDGVRRGKRLAAETVRRHRDGTPILVSVQATPIEVPEGPIGAYAIYRDVTVRRAREQALQESEACYRALFDQSPVGVFLCDSELRITRCNGRLTEIMEVSREEIIGTSLLDLPDARIFNGLSRARAGEPAFYEGPYRPVRGGRTLWISVRYAPLHGPGGTVGGGVGVLEDITGRERTQQELRAQAAELERVNEALRERTLELESALQARSRLYSAMNHELRTPISAIMLYQELLLAGTLGPLAKEQQEAMERSHVAARHLLELVQDVLDLSKIEAGTVSVHPVEVSLPALLRDLRATMLPLARHYGSEIRLEAEPEERPLVTDPQRVRQILLNLLSNAAKFGRGRPIVVRCRTLVEEETWIEVEDRGIGIAATDLPHIFEDFVQVGTQEGGTGLGLAISRRLSGLLRGRLEVESELGEGSTFRLVLPRSPAPQDTTAGEKEGGR